MIDEKCAAINRRVFEESDRGKGYKAIALALADEGYRTEQGQRFQSHHIARILHNKAYIGTLEYNFRQDRGGREPVIIPGFYPPIVEASLFKRVQEKLAKISANWQNTYAHRSEYLLSRLVVCDACEHHYVGTAAKVADSTITVVRLL